MRKHYLLAAIAALTLWSCSNDEITDRPTGSEEANAIGFGTFLPRIPQGSGAATPKAAALDVDTLKAKGFKVIAYSQNAVAWSAYSKPNAPNFMDTVVTWNSSAWEYSPTRYWPRVNETTWGKVSFFAFSKVAGAKLDYSVSNIPRIEFTTSQILANQVDLVADTAYDRTGGDNPKTVKFDFKHILSKIGFSAKIAESYTGTINVKELKVYYNKVDGAISKGYYAFPTRGATSSWTSASTYFGVGDGGLVYSGTKPMNSSTSENLSITDDGKDNGYLMLIPQTLADSAISVELKYEIENPSAATTTTTTRVKLPEFTVDQGKAYSITFNITLDAVVFDNIAVNSWTDGNSPSPVVVAP
jgi:hypothetical protein